ncbi:MAG TPA: hypothetical protein DDW76_02565 [Cyanobacteria bacterium UBA11369]|nr:hypothetical protein [Cyanobacteria bacterium UBA11371]HBE33372.1 hypothetical protein [Cyanobacteria bacterium UBA11368]HBE47712.1 hypothetical protein [Cyanobacteria bacterium UBA11369]
MKRQLISIVAGAVLFVVPLTAIAVRAQLQMLSGIELTQEQVPQLDQGERSEREHFNTTAAFTS